ncbi:MAG: choice-of-anchor B family protein, partial [Gemmatimonadetes bacterium]|nr:choice-of-anchor B family protein [Gemmatimonadota bacterium]
AKIQPSDGAPMNLFGFSVDYDGDQAMIGAPGVSQFHGAAYLFEKNDDGTWTQTGHLSPEGDGMLISGFSVAQTGPIALVGVPGADSGEGRVAIFERDGENGWSEQSSITPPVVEGLAAVTGEQVDCTDGAADTFACNDVDLAAFLPVQAIGGGRGVKLNDIWGWTDPQTGKEYALVGRNNGTSFVDISDPFNPVYVGDLPRPEGAKSSAWRDIKVYSNHAFIVSDNAGAHGMQVFDLTQLRDVMDAPVTFEETANYDGIFSAHNIVINEATGFAYAVGSSAGGETCGGGLHMIDIREPASPTFAGCFSDTSTGRSGTGYSHDAQCVLYAGPDEQYRDREICFGANETALSIADVTDKSSPVAVASATYPNPSYVHQGWISEDHRFFFVNDEGDELDGTVTGTRTLVWDIEDLDDPILAKEHIGETEASDHNLYVRGRFMYQSNYVSGLRILDISDPVNPREVGYFDSVPMGDNSPGYAGSWSNYPFFESGVIVFTSMREGLFVVRRGRRPVL